MKAYVQFYENLKKPIEAIGSDGVYILDGRNSINAMVYDAKDRMKKLAIKNFVGFKIIEAQRFSDKGTEIYSSF